MQDKEFDRLFQSKLGDHETEPSPMVWNNIADELHGKKSKSGMMVYLSIAASITILVSAGLLFFNQSEETFVKPIKRGKVIAKNNKPTPSDSTIKSTSVIMPKITSAPTTEVAGVAKHSAPAPRSTVVEPINILRTQTNESAITTPNQTQPVLAMVTEPVQKERAVVIPDKETSFTSTDEQVLETVVTSTETIKTVVAKKRGIHSFGGLINAIVAKVDKREDKLIEFSDSEDDDTQSNVTGINLGLLRIKKQQQ